MYLLMFVIPQYIVILSVAKDLLLF